MAPTSFIPRTAFHPQASLPRSYFLGHHAAGLAKIKSMAASIDLVIECRDYRIPLTSRNPMFEATLADRPRLVVYTKRDLGSENRPFERAREDMIRSWHHPASVLFSDHKSTRDIKAVLKFATEHAAQLHNLTASRLLVVGMPNVGKSSLLNALRHQGVSRGKVASTGAQPGITRKIASGVKIVDADPDMNRSAVVLLDTPGIFVPFVQNTESMIKLALVGCVKDTILPSITVADYLLYHLNLQPDRLYDIYCPPTNEIVELLSAVAHKTGRLQKGGTPDLEASALWLIQRWRQGLLGKFLLDDIGPDSLRAELEKPEVVSLSQARKQQKVAQRERTRARHLAADIN